MKSYVEKEGNSQKENEMWMEKEKKQILNIFWKTGTEGKWRLKS